LRYWQYFRFFYVGSFRRHRFSDSVFDELFPTGYDHLFSSWIYDHKSGLPFLRCRLKCRQKVETRSYPNFAAPNPNDKRSYAMVDPMNNDAAPRMP
jgi:hypothetical protein